MIKELSRGHTAIGSGSRAGDSMKVFVTGVGGQLGHDVVNNFISKNHEAVGSDIQAVYSGVDDGSAVVTAPYVQLDITQSDAVQRAIEELKPDVVIHCAAWTAVDAAEDEANREKVHQINAVGTENIARAARAVDAKMVYISTDYVFDGQGTRPWEPDDKCYAPLNVYGQSKLDGELAVSSILEKYFIVRIAWVFGLNGKNFIKTMINVGKTHDTVRVVNDQIGTPTYTLDLARLLVDMVETEKYGYYHATNSESEPGGYISWYDSAWSSISNTTGHKGHPGHDKGVWASVAAPYNSRLEKEMGGFRPLRWQDAVKRYLQRSCKYANPPKESRGRTKALGFEKSRTRSM